MRIFISLWILIGLFLFSTIKSAEGELNMSIEDIARKKTHHGSDGRFLNPWCQDCRRNIADFLNWVIFSKNIYKEEKKKDVKFNIVKPDFDSLNKIGTDYIVWLGHSTVLMKIGNKTIITDPVLWDINFLLKRKTPFPIEPEKLPHIDYVLISHGHYDHLDTKSVEFLKGKFNPFFVTGPGYEDYFASIGAVKHIVLDWFENYEIEGIKITALPVQHWSKRSLFDTDKMLWCSFLIETNPSPLPIAKLRSNGIPALPQGEGIKGRVKFYWVGDSGYYNGYKEIGEKFGPIDVVFVPVGAYEPRWFMKTYHVNPEEAVQIAKDVKAENFIPIHWGTFDLTDEPLWLPIKHLKEIYKEDSNPKLKILEHGGILSQIYSHRFAQTNEKD
jgi:L-ascorbate metabolism protein UlaG (beta-lactamase superfamily)